MNTNPHNQPLKMSYRSRGRALSLAGLLKLFAVAGALLTTALGTAEELPSGKLEDGQENGESLSLTIIESELLEMKSTPDKNFFYFEKNVRVRGNNLLVTCDHLEVITLRSGDDPEAPIGKIGSFERIVATGQVAITQAGRQAKAGRAELWPEEGKVVLTESPRIIDDQAEVSGWRITLLKGKRKAVVESNPAGDQGRPTVILDALPDLGYE